MLWVSKIFKFVLVLVWNMSVLKIFDLVLVRIKKMLMFVSKMVLISKLLLVSKMVDLVLVLISKVTISKS